MLRISPDKLTKPKERYLNMWYNLQNQYFSTSPLADSCKTENVCSNYDCKIIQDRSVQEASDIYYSISKNLSQRKLLFFPRLKNNNGTF